MLVRLNKTCKILFMAAFCHITSLHFAKPSLDSVGLENEKKIPLGACGARGLSGAFGTHALLRLRPLAINC
jgi:hypothetical protein